MSRRTLATKAIVEGGATAVLRNQTAWFMGEVVKRGSRGLTKADYPGLHVGDIVMRIRRKLGEEVIVTHMEPNTHVWGNEHGRYVLNAKVTLENLPTSKMKKPAAGSERASKPKTSNGELGGFSDNE